MTILELIRALSEQQELHGNRAVTVNGEEIDETSVWYGYGEIHIDTDDDDVLD